ncbi:MAG: metallophosphoesterase [Acidobacteriia bacterium]|nr:metallophosphoesterase [Terriglobia bacterium]
MRTLNFVVFLTAFFSIYGLLNAYIFLHGWNAIPGGSALRSAYAVVFWVAAFSFIAGRVLERFWLSPLSDTLVWIGAFWFGAMIYFFLIALGLDVLRSINHFYSFFPRFISANYAQAKYIGAAASIGVVGLLLIGGHINALIPRVTPVALQIHKKTEGPKSLNIVAASDIHLGTIIGRHRFDHIVEKINSLHPDVVLLCGDIVDEDVGPVIKENLGEALRNIQSKFGVYGITGNHEFIGGVEPASVYLRAHGVNLLRDQAVKVNNSFYLAGREDRSFNRRGQRRRKSLAELLQNVDPTFPVVVMDHQPFGLKEAIQAGVDLQLSGHTHHGQLWPVNYLIRSMFEVGWGHRQIGQTHFYVSNGVGTWGPPVRIGNRPEIVNLQISFE